jgi:hypothetical protein
MELMAIYDGLPPNESVEEARFWLFSDSEAFDFIDSEFTPILG